MEGKLFRVHNKRSDRKNNFLSSDRKATCFSNKSWRENSSRTTNNLSCHDHCYHHLLITNILNSPSPRHEQSQTTEFAHRSSSTASSSAHWTTNWPSSFRKSFPVDLSVTCLGWPWIADVDWILTWVWFGSVAGWEGSPWRCLEFNHTHLIDLW